MHIDQTLAKSAARVAGFFRKDWKASSIVVTFLMLLSFVSYYLSPPAPRGVAHARIPIWATLLRLAFSIVHWAILLALLLRAKVWTEGNRLNAADTIKEAYSLLGSAIRTLISFGLHYFAIPFMLLLISLFIWPHWSIKNPNLFSIIFFPIGTYAAFGFIFSAPILIFEKVKGLRNVTSSLKLSVKELRITIILIAPWCLGYGLQIAMNWMGWHTYLVSLLRTLIAVLTTIFSFFVYTVVTNLGPMQVDEAA